MAWLTLPGGRRSRIDAADVEWLGRYRWFCFQDRGGRKQYVRGYLRGKSPRDGPGWIHLARLLMQPPPGLQVDHINGDTLDNRRANLRICTPAENRRNRRRYDGSFKGVARATRHTWKASIAKDGVRYYLGTYTTEAAAAAAYNGAAIVLHGQFALLNVIP